MQLQQLGLNSTVHLDNLNDTETEKFIRKLNNIDFGPIAFKLINSEDGEVWTIEQATAAIEDYRRFLLLNFIYPDRIIVPSRIVDRVWHHHILDTKFYFADCMEIFGRFLHHWPYLGMTDDADKRASDAAFTDTYVLWNRHFS